MSALDKKTIIVDEIDILNSKKFIRTLSTGIILKKYIEKTSFDKIKDFLLYESSNDSTFLKEFLVKYETFSNLRNLNNNNK